MSYRGYPPLEIERWLDILKQRECVCGQFFYPEADEALCPACLLWEEQAVRDHRDEVAVAHAATNGTL